MVAGACLIVKRGGKGLEEVPNGVIFFNQKISSIVRRDKGSL